MTRWICGKYRCGKAKKLATEADLVIFVVDSTRTLDENDKDIISLIQDKK